jgi:hypothetical protein
MVARRRWHQFFLFFTFAWMVADVVKMVSRVVFVWSVVFFFFFFLFLIVTYFFCRLLFSTNFFFFSFFLYNHLFIVGQANFMTKQPKITLVPFFHWIFGPLLQIFLFIFFCILIFLKRSHQHWLSKKN